MGMEKKPFIGFFAMAGPCMFGQGAEDQEWLFGTRSREGPEKREGGKGEGGLKLGHFQMVVLNHMLLSGNLHRCGHRCMSPLWVEHVQAALLPSGSKVAWCKLAAPP